MQKMENNQACETVYVHMALWWLCGGYVFPVVVKQEILMFWVKFDLEGQGQSPPQNTRDLNQSILHLWSKFGGPSLNGWQVIVRTSRKWGKSELSS